MAFFAIKGCRTWGEPGGTSSFMPRWSSEESRGLTSVVRKRWSTPLAAMREIDWLIRGPWEVVPVSSGNRDRGRLDIHGDEINKIFMEQFFDNRRTATVGVELYSIPHALDLSAELGKIFLQAGLSAGYHQPVQEISALL